MTAAVLATTGLSDFQWYLVLAVIAVVGLAGLLAVAVTEPTGEEP